MFYCEYVIVAAFNWRVCATVVSDIAATHKMHFLQSTRKYMEAYPQGTLNDLYTRSTPRELVGLFYSKYEFHIQERKCESIT